MEEIKNLIRSLQDLKDGVSNTCNDVDMMLLYSKRNSKKAIKKVIGIQAIKDRVNDKPLFTVLLENLDDERISEINDFMLVNGFDIQFDENFMQNESVNSDTTI